MSEALNTTNLRSINRVKSVAICLTAYLAAVVVVIITGYILQDYHPIIIAGAADLAATIVIFGFSVYYGNASIYDPYWSVAPPFIAAFWLLNSGSINDIGLREALVLILLAFWSVRLTFNWLRRWRGLNHEDWRYNTSGKTGRAFDWLISSVFTYSHYTGFWRLLTTICHSLYGINAFVARLLAIVVTPGQSLSKLKPTGNCMIFFQQTLIKLLSSGLWGYSGIRTILRSAFLVGLSYLRWQQTSHTGGQLSGRL